MPKFKPYQTKNRFWVDLEVSDGPSVVDSLDGSTVSFDKVTQARDFAGFCRAYVKLHGDIDLQSVPYAWNEPLHYARLEGRDSDRRLMPSNDPL